MLLYQDTYRYNNDATNTRGNIQSKTYMFGNAGEEKSDIQISYDFSGAAKTTTKFGYTSGALSSSYVMQGNQYDSAQANKLNTASKTFLSYSVYQGPENDEQVNYTHTFMSGTTGTSVPTPAAANVRNTTIFTYDTAANDKKMLSSAVYSGFLTIADATKLRSRTIYTKARNEEKADSSQNYRPDGTIQSQTEFYNEIFVDHDSNPTTPKQSQAVRATNASVTGDSVLLYQDTYRYDTSSVRGSIQSKTYMIGNAAEEKSDIQISYDFSS